MLPFGVQALRSVPTGALSSWSVMILSVNEVLGQQFWLLKVL